MGGRFAIFCFVLLCIRGPIPITSPRGAYIRGGDLTEGFLRYDFGGHIFGILRHGCLLFYPLSSWTVVRTVKKVAIKKFSNLIGY